MRAFEERKVCAKNKLDPLCRWAAMHGCPRQSDEQEEEEEIYFASKNTLHSNKIQKQLAGYQRDPEAHRAGHLINVKFLTYIQV